MLDEIEVAVGETVIELATTKALISRQRMEPVYSNDASSTLIEGFIGEAPRSTLNDKVTINHCFQLVLNESLRSNQLPTVNDLIHLLAKTLGITDEQVVENYHKV